MQFEFESRGGFGNNRRRAPKSRGETASPLCRCRRPGHGKPMRLFELIDGRRLMSSLASLAKSGASLHDWRPFGVAGDGEEKRLMMPSASRRQGAALQRRLPRGKRSAIFGHRASAEHWWCRPIDNQGRVTSAQRRLCGRKRGRARRARPHIRCGRVRSPRRSAAQGSCSREILRLKFLDQAAAAIRIETGAPSISTLNRGDIRRCGFRLRLGRRTPGSPANASASISASAAARSCRPKDSMPGLQGTRSAGRRDRREHRSQDRKIPAGWPQRSEGEVIPRHRDGQVRGRRAQLPRPLASVVR